MSSRRIMAAIVLTSAALVVAPGKGVAAPPEGVTIVTTQVCPSLEASFVASGAIDDAGTVSATVLTPEAGPFGITGVTLRAEVLFTGGQGTFTLVQHVTFMATDDPDVFAEPGTWVLIGGTGTYAGLRGRGRSDGTCDLARGLEIQTFEGSVG